MRSNNTEIFTTDNFQLACFLLSESCELLSLDRANPKRVSFVFTDTPKRQELTSEFLGHRALVEPHRFTSAQRDLKQLIYEKGNQYT
ncbi:MAG: hypothetical protein A2905_00425 [Candidatus Levybacteria bacterium RIFCSPLOWO2_01_FULL_36_10]|nr:MAG: hypothetical protein A2905_00425 [Candidatus Levybacteria bacterium RIFCSPLOWO2_01_FULL_36_10]